LEHSNEVSRQKVGVKDFDFQKYTVTCPCKKLKRLNLLPLVIHLWPGCWESQLKNLNNRILISNNEEEQQSRGGRFRKMNPISPNEFWVWFGIMLVARIEGRKGDVWDNTDPEGYMESNN
jgi:hypothetical protein